MSGRCDTCGAPSAGLYELALIRVDEQMLDADAVACARMTALCPACRDRLAARVAALVPVWAGDGARAISKARSRRTALPPCIRICGRMD